MNNAPTPTAWIGSAEMASILECHVVTLREWCRDEKLTGALRPHRIGAEGHYRWNRAAVAALFIAQADELAATAAVFDALKAVAEDRERSDHDRRNAGRNLALLVEGNLDVEGLLRSLQS